MIDIGANLANEAFDNDIEEVIHRAKEHKLTSLILTTVDLDSYYKNLEIIQEYEHILPLYTTYGLHPHESKQHESIFPDIDLHLSNPKVKAIGEFGLDYFRMNSPKETQIYVMEKFLECAKSFAHLPLFLHERDSFDDFYSTLKNSQISNKSVVHCFTGNKDNLRKYVDLGCYIGITGWISDSRRNQDLVEAISYLPLDRLMIETDCPYLTPRNLSKKRLRNEPCYLNYIVESLSDLLNVEHEFIQKTTIQNTLDFFNIPHYNINNKLKI